MFARVFNRVRHHIGVQCKQWLPLCRTELSQSPVRSRPTQMCVILDLDPLVSLFSCFEAPWVFCLPTTYFWFQAPEGDLSAAFVLPDGNVMEYMIRYFCLPRKSAACRKPKIDFLRLLTFCIFRSSSSNVEYMKRLVAWLAQCYGFPALSATNGGAVNLAFDLKIPGADFLTREDELLSTIPYVISAKQRRVRAVFLVLPRGSGAERQVRPSFLVRCYTAHCPFEYSSRLMISILGF